MESITQWLLDRIEQELQDQGLNLFNHHALIKAQSKDHIQINQHQQILQPRV
ncbi:MAG: hypothetical protein HC895_13545 [Leptolyngbyaceae cyanobacterium SM1_3_5]|nr:hypothetical protein [Leptolyngbyaceae cyanobacterium SM1_3_5]